MSDLTTAAAKPLQETTLEAAERERRQRVLKRGTASYANRSITVGCVVRDLSSGGAKIMLDQPLPLPDHFTLEIPMDGITADCEVRWRNGDLIGAQFMGEVLIEEKRVRQRVDPTGLLKQKRNTLRKLGA